MGTPAVHGAVCGNAWRIGWDEAETRFSAMRLSFLRESRRLSNARLVADSGIEPHFTDFRDGLAASLRAQSAG